MLTSGMFGYLADYVLWWLVFVSLVIHTWCFFRFFPRKKRPRVGLLLGNLLVFMSLTGAVALIGETYFRFISVSTDSFGVSLPARRWFTLYTDLNTLDCRDVEWSRKKPTGVRRIAFVGDSFTYGWGIERVEDRFTERLQAMFDRREPGRTEVLNVAKPGWGTDDQLQPVRDMIDVFGVDEIVLAYVPNDIESLLPTSPDFDPTRPPDARLVNLDASCLIDALYRRLVVPRLPAVAGYMDWLAEGYADETIWRHQQRQIHDIIRACRDRDVTIRVVLLPFLRTRGDKFDAPRLQALLREVFEVAQVPVVDGLDALSGRDPAGLTVSAQDAHPNEEANRLLAEAIWQAFYADVNE